MEDIRKNIELLENKINQSAIQVGRKKDEIQLIAVGKTFPVEVLQQAQSYGICVFGENKVQELVEKMNCMSKDIKWHMIGHLQRNKAKFIIGEVELIHSLDSLGLAKEIDKIARKKDCIQKVLVQVNISEEETKFGLPVDQVEGFLEDVSTLAGLRVKGLMTIGPNTKEHALIRECFKRMHSIYIDIKQKRIDNIDMDILSMGMSKDFEIAIQEGANMVRVGSAIFGKRTYANND